VTGRLKLAKLEDDSDYHLVIAQPGAPKKTMIVEFPHPGCTEGAIKRKLMRHARNRFADACGPVGSSDFKELSGKALIEGVGFWDIPHGQTGAAPNQLELHPVLRFRMVNGVCPRQRSALDDDHVREAQDPVGARGLSERG
jgi:hypothetical protein